MSAIGNCENGKPASSRRNIYLGGRAMTIPELETALLYHVTPNERKRLKWYKRHDVVKFVKELGKLWQKYKGEENG